MIILKNNNLAPNTNDDGISKQVSQGNNGENSQENNLWYNGILEFGL